MNLGDSLKDKVDINALKEQVSENYEDSREGYYSARLNLTGDLEDDVDKLYDFYMERIGDRTNVTAVRETIHEYITYYNDRGIDGPEWVAFKIAQVGRKGDSGKKNLSYLIGCLRNVLEYGVSSTNSPVERRLISSFESKYKIQLSPQGRQRLMSVATRYGTIDSLFAMLEADIIVEDILLDSFEIYMEENKIS